MVTVNVVAAGCEHAFFGAPQNAVSEKSVTMIGNP